jgi:hypothetical protein
VVIWAVVPVGPLGVWEKVVCGGEAMVVVVVEDEEEKVVVVVKVVVLLVEEVDVDVDVVVPPLLTVMAPVIRE